MARACTIRELIADLSRCNPEAFVLCEMWFPDDVTYVDETACPAETRATLTHVAHHLRSWGSTGTRWRVRYRVSEMLSRRDSIFTFMPVKSVVQTKARYPPHVTQKRTATAILKSGISVRLMRCLSGCMTISGLLRTVKRCW